MEFPIYYTISAGQGSQYFFCRPDIVKFLAFLCKNGLLSCNFCFFITIFNKNNMKFVISVGNCVDWYINRDISTQTKNFNFFVPGHPEDFFEKKIFVKKYANGMSIDSVIDADYESGIIFMKICTWKMKIVKYERIFGI